MATKSVRPPTDKQLAKIALALGDALREHGWMLATAESCTGGWLAKLVTDQSGSSEWFDRTFVTYSNAAKHEMLGVDQRILDEHGAVSEETVRAMAQGALDRSVAQVTIAISGIAGPDGGTPEKPVGTVWFAWMVHTESLTTRCDRFTGERDSVRRQAAYTAMDQLLKMLLQSE